MIEVANLAETREQLLAGIEIEPVDVVEFLINRGGRALNIPSEDRSSESVRE